MRLFTSVILLAALPAACRAQSAIEFGPLAVVPAGGYKTGGWSAGPGWRAGYQRCLLGPLGAEAGLAAAWPLGPESCNRFACVYSRRRLELLDYGLQGAVAAGRAELSLGFGGAYLRGTGSGSDPFAAGRALLQYSAGAALALDRRGRFRAAFRARICRDPGRPTEQWLLTSVGLAVGLGRRP